ncbi:type II secretion system protein GspJ [Gammaproteobacteria bacterium]|nr:type II secretion system protein GspJ [Gammaproteobacteria bacterium]
MNNRPANPRSHGFTLLEVLVAAAITAFIGGIAITALLSFVNVQQRTRIEAQDIFRVQGALLQFERDVDSYAPLLTRSTREQPERSPIYLDPLNPQQDFELLRMSVQGEDLRQDGGWRIARVGWGLDEDQNLFRDYWPYVEVDSDLAPSDTTPRRRVLLEGVEHVSIYARGFGSDLEQRRRDIFVNSDQFGNLLFADALEIVIELEDGTTWQKLVSLPSTKGGAVQ